VSKRDWRESDEDVENVEAWVEIVYDLLDLVPDDLRARVLAFAAEKEEAARKELEEAGGFIARTLSEIDLNTPGIRHWHTIMRLKSLVVQVFVRHIRNNHSPKDAAGILFVEHPHGDGSGSLGDYLDDLPRPR
jgi:hypothetical protein